jgi:hypothetical protein
MDAKILGHVLSCAQTATRGLIANLIVSISACTPVGFAYLRNQTAQDKVSRVLPPTAKSYTGFHFDLISFVLVPSVMLYVSSNI